jgi:hypothetical protein
MTPMRAPWVRAALAGLAALAAASPCAAFEAQAPAGRQNAKARESWTTLLADAPSGGREAQRARLAQLAWTRDPFVRGGSGLMSGYVLSGILWDATAPIAIINGEMLRAGDRLDGYRVTKIEQDRVTITDGDQTLQLQIAP